MTWWEYVGEVSGGATQDSIARRAGIAAPTVTRWRTSTPRPESVAGFARAYERPVLEAFVAAGFLTPEEARAQVTFTRQEELSDEELLEILRRRLDRDRQESGSRGNTAPMSQLTADELAQLVDVVTEANGTARDVLDLARVARGRPGNSWPTVDELHDLYSALRPEAARSDHVQAGAAHEHDLLVLGPDDREVAVIELKVYDDATRQAFVQALGQVHLYAVSGADPGVKVSQGEKREASDARRVDVPAGAEATVHQLHTDPLAPDVTAAAARRGQVETEEPGSE